MRNVGFPRLEGLPFAEPVRLRFSGHASPGESLDFVFSGKLGETPLWVETQYYLLYFPLLTKQCSLKSGLLRSTADQ